MTTTTESKLIRRNATKKQAAIFSAVKSAQIHTRSNNYTAEPFTNLEKLQEFYNESTTTKLYETGEGEYYLSICPETWFVFSTNEPQPAPAAEVAPEVAPEPKAQIEVAPVAPVAPVADITEPEQIEITLERIEGLTPAQHANPDLAKVTVKGWLTAENVLKAWAKTFTNADGSSRGSGCDNCDVTIHFPDNQKYKTQYGISYFDTLEPRLLKQVKSDLEFMAGKRPSDITDDYFEFLDTLYSNDAANVEIINYWLESFIYPALISNRKEHEISEAKQPSFSYFEYDVKHYPTGSFFKVWKSSAQKCWVRTNYDQKGFNHQYGFLTPQLAIKGAIATNQQPLSSKVEIQKAKAAIQSITLHRAEGRHSECIKVTVNSWEEADETMKQWAKTAPVRNGAHKCDIDLLFADGESFNTGWELQLSDVPTFNLAKHVLAEISFLAGTNPGNLSAKEYQHWLSQPWAKPAEYKRLLDQWLIPG